MSVGLGLGLVVFFWFISDYFVCVVCFCCVWFSFFRTMPRDRMRRKYPKWPFFEWDVKPQSMIQSVI